MVEVIFNYKGIETIIQCNINDKMKDIINKFISKTQNNIKNKYYFYNGDKINEELTFNKQANEIDNKRKKMNILVYDEEEKNDKDDKDKSIIKSKEIICPECKENILIKFQNNKINLYECKNNHIKNNILLEEYENTQKIDISKIKCDKCKEKSINDTYNNEFYICNSCDIKLCPLCQSIHDKNHNIINYNDKNYICRKHNVNYIRYCKECKINICLLCEDEHKNHDNISFRDMIINKDNILKEYEELRKIIDKLRMNIEEIKNILNKVMNNIEIYYKINKEIINNYINNYDIKKKNYYILKNINEIKNNNKIMIKELNDIIEEGDINKKVNYLMNIYDKNINYINKKEIYENGEEYIGEFKNNLRNGKGILYYNKNDNRDRYEGEWKNDKREGKGICYFKNGDRYEGEWKNDKMEGKGIFYFNNGNRYEGQWKMIKEKEKEYYIIIMEIEKWVII